MAALALGVAACAADTIVPDVPRVVIGFPIAPFEIHEECVQLVPGDRLDFRFEAQRPVAFLIYYKDGITFIAPVSRETSRNSRASSAPCSSAAIACSGKPDKKGRSSITGSGCCAAARLDDRAPQDALLFDLDGTLTDNFVGIARSIAYAMERLRMRCTSRRSIHRFLAVQRIRERSPTGS